MQNNCLFKTFNDQNANKMYELESLLLVINPDPTATIFSETVHRGRFIVTVDRNNRTATPKFPLNKLVLCRCMYLSWISIKLNCLDTIPLVSLDSILFLFHFCIHGGVEIKIWWRIEGEIAA